MEVEPVHHHVAAEGGEDGVGMDGLVGRGGPLEALPFSLPFPSGWRRDP